MSAFRKVESFKIIRNKLYVILEISRQNVPNGYKESKKIIILDENLKEVGTTNENIYNDYADDYYTKGKILSKQAYNISRAENNYKEIISVLGDNLKVVTSEGKTIYVKFVDTINNK